MYRVGRRGTGKAWEDLSEAINKNQGKENFREEVVVTNDTDGGGDKLCHISLKGFLDLSVRSIGMGALVE